jgi:hypothetical protein
MVVSRINRWRSCILILVGVIFLPYAASRVPVALREFGESGFRPTGYVVLASAVVFGILGLGSFLAGVVLFRLARR